MALSRLRFAWRSLRRHPRRSALVVLALAGGLFVLVFLKALQAGFVEQRLESGLGLQLGHLTLTAADTSRGLHDIDALCSVLEAQSDVLAAAPRVHGRAFARSARGSAAVSVLGVDVERESRAFTLPDLLLSGEFLGKRPIGTLPPVVLGDTLAAALELSLGDQLALLVEGRDGSLHAEAFKVDGLFHSGAPSIDGAAVYLQRRHARVLLDVSAEADDIALRCVDPLTAEALASRLRALPELSGHDIRSWSQTAPELRSALDMLSLVERVRTLVLFVLVGLGTLNAVSMSVFERRREFGMLLSLGLRPWAVARLVLLEMTLLAAAGLALGGGLAWFVVSGVLAEYGLDVSALGARLPGALEGTSVLFPVFVPEHLFMSALWVGLLSLSVLAWPLLSLLRLDPAQVLRDRA
ncbi:MAG: ABC transporter [Planctomycetota bacterium]|nr:MAG: ABC transporter [Planctomycetota bacterium]